MKYYFLFLISVVLLYVGCAVRQKPQQAAPPLPPPPETSFIKNMVVGDTVFIFFKQSGWTDMSNSSVMRYYSFYARSEVIKISENYYKVARTNAYQTDESLKAFEFDTMKYRLTELLALTTSFTYYCKPEIYQPSDEEKEKCIWFEDYTDKPIAYFNYFIEDEMCDGKYEKWRFSNPSYSELDSWRKKDYDWPIWKTEMLAFWSYTCKISYTDHLHLLYG